MYTMQQGSIDQLNRGSLSTGSKAYEVWCKYWKPAAPYAAMAYFANLEASVTSGRETLSL